MCIRYVWQVKFNKFNKHILTPNNRHFFFNIKYGWHVVQRSKSISFYFQFYLSHRKNNKCVARNCRKNIDDLIPTRIPNFHFKSWTLLNFLRPKLNFRCLCTKWFSNQMFWTFGMRFDAKLLNIDTISISLNFNKKNNNNNLMDAVECVSFSVELSTFIISKNKMKIKTISH